MSNDYSQSGKLIDDDGELHIIFNELAYMLDTIPRDSNFYYETLGRMFVISKILKKSNWMRTRFALVLEYWDRA